MAVIVGLVLSLLLSALLGAFVGVQKRRGAIEGFFLGLIFGPLGVIVEALLPTGEAGVGPKPRRNIDDLGTIASIAERFRCVLDEIDPAWERLPYHRKRSLLKPHEKRVRQEYGLPPSTFADFAAEARRKILAPKPPSG